MWPFSRRRPTGRRSLFSPVDLAQRPRHENEAAIRALCMTAYLGQDTALCRVLGRYKMFVDTRDLGHSTHLMLDGFWEMWVTEVLVERVKPGMVAVDVGANLGYFSMLLAGLVGPTGHVHAIEPNPAIAQCLRQSAHVNGFWDNLTLHEAVLGADEGLAVSLAVPPGEPKNAHVVPPDEAIGPILATRRFDGMPALLDADFVKIDAEGAEEAIWHGMAGLFARKRPLTVVLEFAAARYGDPGAFLDGIAALGFDLSLIEFEAGVVPRTKAEVLAAPAHLDQMLILTR